MSLCETPSTFLAFSELISFGHKSSLMPGIFIQPCLMPKCLKAAVSSVGMFQFAFSVSGKSPLHDYANLISRISQFKHRVGTFALSPMVKLANSFSKRASGDKPQMLSIQCHLSYGCGSSKQFKPQGTPMTIVGSPIPC